MAEPSKESPKDSSNHDLFVTEFPKKGFGIVDYLQGRMHFALMDQMKLMSKSRNETRANQRRNYQNSDRNCR